VVPLGDLEAKFNAFGWTVISMDGNNMSEVVDAFRKAQMLTTQDSPVIMLMKTRMGCGVDFMLDNHEWHGVPPNDEQTKKALAQLDETLEDY
jgi:transketolase